MNEDIFEKAKLLHHLVYEKGKRIVDLSKELKIKPSSICHLLRLNRLPPLIIDGYYSQLISVSHLFVISRIKEEKKLIELYEKILAENLTVAQTEEEVRGILHQIKTKGQYLSKQETSRLTERLKEYSKNIKTKIVQTRIKTKLILEMKGSLEETTPLLQKILEKLTE
jgi:ParB family chromosome partitioning protein